MPAGYGDGVSLVIVFSSINLKFVLYIYSINLISVLNLFMYL